MRVRVCVVRDGCGVMGVAQSVSMVAVQLAALWGQAVLWQGVGVGGGVGVSYLCWLLWLRGVCCV